MVSDVPVTANESYKYNRPFEHPQSHGNSFLPRKSDSASHSFQQTEPYNAGHETHQYEQQSSASHIGHRAVQILRSDVNSTYSVDENQLETVFGQKSVADLPVAVYSVAGAFRKGKSFMLNFFIRFLTAVTEGKVSSKSCNCRNTNLQHNFIFNILHSSKNKNCIILAKTKVLVVLSYLYKAMSTRTKCAKNYSVNLPTECIVFHVPELG